MSVETETSLLRRAVKAEMLLLEIVKFDDERMRAQSIEAARRLLVERGMLKEEPALCPDTEVRR